MPRSTSLARRHAHQNQLTLTGLDDELLNYIRRLARHEKLALNDAAVQLLRTGVGHTFVPSEAGVVGSSLDHFIGSSTAAEADELDSALRDLKAFFEPKRTEE